VKVCGLSRPEDVELCAGLGAEFLGFNFSAESPRRIGLEQVSRAVCAGGSARRVGVFVSETAGFIREAIEAGRLQLLQFHRELSAADFEFGLPVVAVCRVGSDDPRLPAEALLSRCRALLFDTADPSKVGGTGAAFDWGKLEGRHLSRCRWLAGGLRAENVEAAIRLVRPEVVDVASGVEISPGVKDHEQLKRFFDAVRRAA
jgi:phosphoribosylanthranilate isomerase